MRGATFAEFDSFTWSGKIIKNSTKEFPIIDNKNRSLTDGIVFVSILLSVMGLWIAYFGIFPDELMAGYDAFAYILDTGLMEAVGFDYSKYLYRYEIMGGTQIYDIYGMPGFFQFLRPFSSLLLHPITVFNAYILFYQALFGYFGSKSISHFRRYFYESENGPIAHLLTGLIMAFMPMLGLRITHGHINPEFIVIPLFFTCFLGVQQNRFSLFDLILCTLVLITNSPPNGQMAVYVAFFTLPVFISLSVELWQSGNRKRLIESWSILITLCVGSLLIFFPEFSDRLAYLSSSDALRSFNTGDIVYSYTIHTMKDLLASVSYILEPFQTRSDTFLLHETNYPTGPIIFCLFLLPLKRHRIFFAGVVVAAVAIFGFSMNLTPIQDLILSVNPVLKSFRVPARSVGIFVIISTILSLSFLSEFTRPEHLKSLFRNQKLSALGILLAITLSIAPVVIREIIFWIILLTGILFYFRKVEFKWISFFLPVLLGVSLSSFRERFTPSALTISKLNQIRATGDELRRVGKGIHGSLERVSTLGNTGSFGLNFPLALGLSSIDGYRLMHKRFLVTLNEIRSVKTEPLTQVMYIHPDQPNYDLMANLFNIVAIVHVDFPSGKIAKEDLVRESRPAWFVKSLSRTEGSQLADFKAQVYETGIIVEDNFFHLTKAYPGCELARVVDVRSQFNDQTAIIELHSPQECPLIVSTNYTEKLHAFELHSGKVLEKFPAWGTLMGILVPGGVKEIALIPQPAIPSCYWLVPIGGWLLILLVFTWRLKGLLVPLLPGNRRDRA